MTSRLPLWQLVLIRVVSRVSWVRSLLVSTRIVLRLLPILLMRIVFFGRLT